MPFGLGAAIYLSEYAGRADPQVLKPILEVLAGIPSVVYGFFALHFVDARSCSDLSASTSARSACSPPAWSWAS